MTRQMNQWGRRKENLLTGMKDVSFKINTIYVDDSSECYGTFKHFCKEKHIDVVQFTPSTGTKRWMGRVEMKLHGYHHSLVNTLPKILTQYNMGKRQRGVVDHYRRQTRAKKVGFKA